MGRMNLQAGSESTTPRAESKRDAVQVESCHVDLAEEKWQLKREQRRAAFYRGSKSPRSPRTPGSPRKNASMTDIFQNTIEEKGMLGLYSGLGPKLVHTSLTNAIMFVAKERFVVYTFALMLYLVRIRERAQSKG